MRLTQNFYKFKLRYDLIYIYLKLNVEVSRGALLYTLIVYNFRYVLSNFYSFNNYEVFKLKNSAMMLTYS